MSGRIKCEASARKGIESTEILYFLCELLTNPPLEHLGSFKITELKSVVLPLYSVRTGEVPERSGINQWNALGRQRAFGEAYIPVPKAFRIMHPDFFPMREIPFRLVTPDQRKFSAKICQQDGKALMTNPNRGICDWLFRKIDKSELASRMRQIEKNPYSYADLESIGVDSVVIRKVDDERFTYYQLEPASMGSYERFLRGKLPTEAFE